MKKIILVTAIVILSFIATLSYAKNDESYKGTPVKKISEGGIERTPQDLSLQKATSFECIISQIDGKYYWTTRENTPLVRVDNGAFITFIAVNGSGYIRIIKPDFKSAASQMSDSEKTFDYVEHLLVGLRSVTYYGKMKYLKPEN